MKMKWKINFIPFENILVLKPIIKVIKLKEELKLVLDLKAFWKIKITKM